MFPSSSGDVQVLEMQLEMLKKRLRSEKEPAERIVLEGQIEVLEAQLEMKRRLRKFP